MYHVWNRAVGRMRLFKKEGDYFWLLFGNRLLATLIVGAG